VKLCIKVHVGPHFALPDTPGYGIELDDSKIESREQAHWS
jgi:L-alanine-DL-glutamate epimerase-like enolase superfamily enzyme